MTLHCLRRIFNWDWEGVRWGRGYCYTAYHLFIFLKLKHILKYLPDIDVFVANRRSNKNYHNSRIKRSVLKSVYVYL